MNEINPIIRNIRFDPTNSIYSMKHLITDCILSCNSEKTFNSICTHLRKLVDDVDAVAADVDCNCQLLQPTAEDVAADIELILHI